MQKLLLFIFILLSIGNLITYNQTRSMLIFNNKAKPRTQIKKLSYYEKLKLIFTGINNPKPTIRRTPDQLGLQFQELKIKNKEIELSAWLIKNYKSNDYIILYHGAMGTKDLLLEQAKAFFELNYNVVLIDFRGSGGSNQSYTTIGYLEAHDVNSSVDYIYKNYKPSNLILYGVSLGAAAIFRAVSELNVKADKLIVEAIYNNMNDTIKNRFTLVGLPSFLVSELMIFWANQLFPINGFKMNPEDFAKNIQIPTLFLHGGKDLRAKPEQAKRVYKNLNTDRKMFVLFPDCKHESYILKDYRRWENSVASFIKK